MISRRKFYFLSTILFIAFVLAVSMNEIGYADYQTGLEYSGYILDGSDFLDVGLFSVPVVYDGDSDGKKDLLVGQNNNGHGYISFYENLGDNDAPSFNGYNYIQACTPTCSPLDVLAGG